MTVTYCDICGETINGNPYRLKLWQEKNIYGFNDVCQACAGKIAVIIDNMKEGKQ